MYSIRSAFLLVVAVLLPLASQASVPLAERALARGDWATAARELRVAAERSSDPALAARATRTAFTGGQLDETLRAAGRWLELSPGDEVARRHRAIVLLRQHRIPAAIDEFNALFAAAYPDPARGYQTLLGLLLEERNNNGAARVMEAMVARHPELPEAHYASAVLWLSAEDAGRALERARAALAARPNFRQAQLLVERARFVRGERDAAIESTRALAQDGDPYTRLVHAGLLLANDRDPEARAVYESLLQSRVATEDALAALGSLDYRLGNDEAATARFTELSRLSRTSDQARWYLAQLASKRGDRRGALTLFERVEGDRALAARLQMVRLLNEGGAPLEAEFALDDYLADDTADVPGLVLGRAALLGEAGRHDEALAMIARLRGVYPDDDALRLGEAFAHERAARIDQAIALMRSLLRDRPDDPDVQNALGYTLIDRTSRVAEGYALVAKAFAQKPDSIAIEDSYGWALHRLGRSAEGLPHLERAWKNSGESEVAAHYGEALWAVGRRDEARALWQEALRDSPDSPHLKAVLERYGTT